MGNFLRLSTGFARSFAESGSGGGNNLIPSNDSTFENNSINNHTRYQNSALVDPIDGVGGTPSANLTIAATGTNPLDGSYSLLWTKSGAANMQGYGEALSSIPVPIALRGQNLTLQFYYSVSSGTYTAGDIRIWMYDQTSGSLIAGDLVSLPATNTGVALPFAVKFACPVSCANLRMIIHTSSTTVNNYTLRFDDFSIWASTSNVAAVAISDWVSFTPTITGSSSNPSFGTVAFNTAYWRRVGDSMQIRWEFEQTTSGSAGAGAYLFNLPGSYTIDSSKTSILPGPGNLNMAVGSANVQSTAAVTSIFGATTLFIDQANGNFWGSGSNSFTASNLQVGLTATIPITGWTSNVILSNSQVEYASNSGMGDSDNTTSFVNDINGSPIPVVTYSTTRLKRIRFANPIQPTDTIQFQVKSGNFWITLTSDVHDTTSTSYLKAYNGDVGYGMGIYIFVNSTDADIAFAQYQEPPSSSWAGANTSRWRVVKYSNQLPVQSVTTTTLGAPVGDWQGYVPTVSGSSSNPTKGTMELDQAYWRRVGDSIEVQYSFYQNGAGSSGSGNYYIGLPNGLAIDTNKISTAQPAKSVNGAIGSGEYYSSAGSLFGNLTVCADVNGNIILIDPVTTNEVGSTFVALGNTGARWTMVFTCPIKGWGSTIALSDSKIEYAANSGMGDADDLTSFVYGTGGAHVPNVTYTGSRQKYVQFQTDIQPTDTVQLQIQPDATRPYWVDMPQYYNDEGGNAGMYEYDGNTYGFGIDRIVGTNTIRVSFAQYRAPGNTNWAAGSTSRWRLVKYANALPVEAGIVSGNSSETVENLTLLLVAASSALTVSAKTLYGADPGAANAVKIAFRGPASASPIYNLRTLLAPLSMTIPSGATLGIESGSNAYIYWYMLDNGGVMELAVSASWYDDSNLISTTILNTSSDDGLTVYSTTARSSVPCRLIGRSLYNTAPNGTYSTIPNDSVLLSSDLFAPEFQRIKSANKTLTGNNYPALSGNSIVLQPGRYVLKGMLEVNEAAAQNTSFFSTDLYWCLANGADNGSTPASILSSAKLTVSGSDHTYWDPDFAQAAQQNQYQFWNIQSSEITVDVKKTETIFLDSFMNGTNNTNVFIFVEIMCRRIKI